MKDKILLWDYLLHVTQQWNGKVIIMGDFNKVRVKSDRFGSVFHAHGANLFNSFITNAGLIEVPLGGSTFTWCHKSATKMSKLDRFLISETSNYCPYITKPILGTLSFFYSDHNTPYLASETVLDYALYIQILSSLVGFRRRCVGVLGFGGFDKFVEDNWRGAPVVASNAMSGFVYKLKYLKVKIREWSKCNKRDTKSGKSSLQDELHVLDSVIDSGVISDDLVNKRSEVIHSLLDIDKRNATEMAQKAKIRWCIEGDENSSFFHGMLNKRRSQLSIRGILVDGVWLQDPSIVKKEFYLHFSKRFAKPDSYRAHLNMEYPITLSPEQQSDLELLVPRRN
ncbi:RNA-directed DNA polymerase, eukaryota [Tanacetum coccineum]|uniref:RNA-directed DNA polymerase, eukaryota n=1 Tax=Tanacetum coccineum TaxID=301880 RepID=A0ABQ5EQL0_9ASTR